MKKVFIDTNVWLRYLVADDPKIFEVCKKLFALGEEGKIRSYTSTIVLMEMAYTLKTFYKVTQNRIVGDLEAILAGRNLTLVEKTNLPAGMKLMKKYSIRLAGCLIVTQLPKKAVLCSYDRDFKKVKGLNWLTPEEIVDRITADEKSKTK